MLETTSSKSVLAPILPLFGLSKLDLPNMDVPTALREAAEKGVAQIKDTYEKAKAAAEEAVDVVEETYLKAAKGAAEYNRQVIEAARSNANAVFDYAVALLAVKSPTEVAELSVAHVRGRFEALTEQTKALGGLVQKLAAETAEPIKAGVGKVFKNAA